MFLRRRPIGCSIGGMMVVGRGLELTRQPNTRLGPLERSLRVAAAGPTQTLGDGAAPLDGLIQALNVFTEGGRVVAEADGH
eukprot:scaffold216212_cov32-Tisochrysis_lutea.AAC.6